MYTPYREFTAKDLLSFLDSVSGKKDLISFFNSALGKDFIPVDDIKNIVLEIMDRYRSDIYEYGSPQGEYQLRHDITNLFLSDLINNNNVIITSGSQQGLDLTVRVLTKQKKHVLRVAIEDPTYIGFKHILQSWGAETSSLIMERDGVNIAAFHNLIKRKKIDCLYIIPDFHNPTGATLSLEKRKQLAEICRENNIFIIEDVSYRWLQFDNNAYLPLLSELNKYSCLVGSFSKMLTPGFRIGWVYTAKTDLYDQLVMEKRASELFQPYLPQLVIHSFIQHHNFFDYLKRTKKLLQYRRDYLYKLLVSILPEHEYEIVKPTGGLYLWVKGPVWLNTYELQSLALKYNVIFGTGRFFMKSAHGDQFMRFSYSSLSLSEMRTGIIRLYRVMKSYYRLHKKDYQSVFFEKTQRVSFVMDRLKYEILMKLY